MSVESAKAFLAKVQKDAKLQKQLKAAANVGDKLKIAKAAGFEFTGKEFQSLRDKAGELSDQDLEKVAGGGCGIDYCTFEGW